jgi:hypothetical protein
VRYHEKSSVCTIQADDYERGIAGRPARGARLDRPDADEDAERQHDQRDREQPARDRERHAPGAPDRPRAAVESSSEPRSALVSAMPIPIETAKRTAHGRS